MVEFKETPERMTVVEGLKQLADDAEKIADQLALLGHRDRSMRVLHLAQGALSQRSLIAMDWHDADAQDARAA